MHLIRTQRLNYAQGPQVVVHLIFTYSGRDVSPPFPTFHIICSRALWRPVAQWRTEAKYCCTSAFSLSIFTSVLALFNRGVCLPRLRRRTFLANVPVEAFLVLHCTFCQVQFKLGLDHPYTAQRHPYTPPRIPVPTSTACDTTPTVICIWDHPLCHYLQKLDGAGWRLCRQQSWKILSLWLETPLRTSSPCIFRCWSIISNVLYSDTPTRSIQSIIIPSKERRIDQLQCFKQPIDFLFVLKKEIQCIKE